MRIFQTSAIFRGASAVLLLLVVNNQPDFSLAGTVKDPHGYRLKLSFFEYEGAAGEEPRIQLGRFKGILRDKVTVLVQELQSTPNRYLYLRALALIPIPASEDKLTSENDVQQYWEVSRSLLLFRGTLFSDAAGYFAQSRLYWGDLRGGMSQPSISARLPIKSEEFLNTNDTHSLIVYFALAQDAIRMGDDPAAVIELLNRAQDKIRDLKSAGPLSPPLAELDRAVQKALKEQKGKGGTP